MKKCPVCYGDLDEEGICTKCGYPESQMNGKYNGNVQNKNNTV